MAQAQPASRFRPVRVARAVGYGVAVAMLAPAAFALVGLVVIAIMTSVESGNADGFLFAIMLSPLFTAMVYVAAWPWGLSLGVTLGVLFLLRGDFAFRMARQAERRAVQALRAPPRLKPGHRFAVAAILIAGAPLLPALVYTGATLGHPFPPIKGWEAYTLSLIVAVPGAALLAFVARDRIRVLDAAWTHALAWILIVLNAGHEMDELMMLAVVATTGAVLAGAMAKVHLHTPGHAKRGAR